MAAQQSSMEAQTREHCTSEESVIKPSPLPVAEVIRRGLSIERASEDTVRRIGRRAAGILLDVATLPSEDSNKIGECVAYGVGLDYELTEQIENSMLNAMDSYPGRHSKDTYDVVTVLWWGLVGNRLVSLRRYNGPIPFDDGSALGGGVVYSLQSGPYL